MQKSIETIFFSLFFLKLYSCADCNIDNLLLSLNDDLNKYEKIATKTKHNEHYQPYIISIMEGKTLEKLGVSSLEDALKLIPGVDITSDNLNFKSPVFRGSNPTSFGQSTLLIDGVLVNNIFTGGYSEYLAMPIEMIKRVEVIRGSGSQSDGINAYAGSINVITYAGDIDSKDLIFVKVGSSSYRSGGFRKGYRDGKFSFFSDFYYQEDDKREHTGLNGLATGILDVKTPWYTLENSRLATSGYAPLWFKNYSLGLNVSYGYYSIKGRVNEMEQGGAYGVNYVQSKDNDVIGLPNSYIEFTFDKTVEDLQIVSKLGFKRDSILLDFVGFPAGIELPKLSNPKEYFAYPTESHLDLYAKQSTLYHSIFLNYNSFLDHEITVGYYLAKIKTDDMMSKAINRDTGIGWVDYTDIYPFFDKSASREVYTLFLQDKYQYSDALQFLYSLNYENNSHIDGTLNPRISFVYQNKNDDIYKFSFSSSHRSPSWQELYTINNHARVGNKNMKSEHVKAYEGAYIRHFSNDSYIQANVYYLINKDQIHNLNKEHKYTNSAKENSLFGTELEYKGSITSKDNVYINFSYTDGENSDDQTLSHVSKFLAKGYYIYNIFENLSLSSTVKYSSEKGRLDMDSRDSLDAYTEVDMALVYKNYSADVDITLSVKNIFDKEGRYPSAPFTYIDDYPKEGRTFLLTLKKEF